MELAKLILEYVKAVAWPITVLTFVLIFRVPLKTIFSRLRKAGLPGGVSIELEEEIREAKELSEQVEASPPPPGRTKTPAIPQTEANARMISLGLQPSSSGLDMSYYREIAQRDPKLALAGLRIELEVLANNLASGYQLERERAEPIGSLLKRLRDRGAITSEQMVLARKVLDICSKAIHGQAVSLEEALDVIDIADVLARDFLAWLSWGFKDNWKPSAGAATVR